MRLRITVVLLLYFILSGSPCYSQDNVRLQEKFFDAEYFLMTGDYADALPAYQEIYAVMPDNANIAFRIGLCYLNIEDKKNLSIDYLEKATQKLTAKYHDGSFKNPEAPYEALYYLGNAYRINFRFDKAIETYQRYRKTLLSDDTENIRFIDQEINSCKNAVTLIDNPVKFSAEPLSVIINDSKDNFFPVVSEDGKSITYMTSMKFYDAVMFTRFVRGEWLTPVNITPELQSDGDQYVSCLSVNGGLLLLSKDDNFDSGIWISNFDGVRWGPARKLKKNINTKYWDTHGYLTEDGTRMVFASDRPGGFGGLDLYISTIDKSGEWGNPVNMGPEINTPFNEDRPFLIENGKLLFFTSQGHYNMGGYDIFRSELQSNGLWSKPANLGYPLNTPDDNIFFCPADHGKSGYISLKRKDKGSGDDDIYKIVFK